MTVSFASATFSSSTRVRVSTGRRRHRSVRSRRGDGRVGAARWTVGVCVRALGGQDGDDDAEKASATSSSSSTLTNLDAILGTTSEEPTTTSTASFETATESIDREGLGSSGPNANAGKSPTASALSDESPTSGGVGVGVGRQPSALDRTDPYVGYEIERDWLGAGPKWDVPWGIGRLALTMVVVDFTFYLAGFLSPIFVYSNVRAPDEIPEDADKLAADLQSVFDDPTTFSDIFLNAEITQIVLGLVVLGISMAPFAPLPKGWFNDALSSDEPERNASGRRVSKGTRARIEKSMDERRDGSGKEALRAILGTYLGVSLVTWILYAAGVRGGESGQGSSSVDIIAKAFEAGPHGIVNLIITTVVLAPIFEEILFRGYMMPSLTKYMPTSAAVGVSALIFALIHQHGVGDTVQLIAVGLACGICYSRTRNLGASIAVHAAFNGAVIALFALWVS